MDFQKYEYVVERNEKGIVAVFGELRLGYVYRYTESDKNAIFLKPGCPEFCSQHTKALQCEYE